MNHHHKSILTASASLLAMMLAAPAFAQDAASTSVDQIVVTGIRASLRASIDSKRAANAVVDVITAEDIGKFPDTNVAESLSHVPGVTVDHAFGQGEKVSILGTDPALNRTLLNGQTVASADWFILDQPGRTFNYTLLAPEVVGRAEVYKSPEPRIDEGSIGGTVILSTRKPLDLPAGSISGTVGYGYNDRAGKGHPNASVLGSWKNADQTFGALLSYQHFEESIRRDGFETYGTTSAADYLAGGSTAAGLAANPTARGPNALGTSFFQQKRKRDGFSGALQWKPNDRVGFDFNALYVKASYDNFNQSAYAFMSNRPGSLTSATISNGVITGGTFNAGGQSILDAQIRTSDVKTYAYDLKGSWDIGSGWDATAQIGTTKATGGTKQQYFGEFIAYGAYSYDISGAPGKSPTLTYANGLAQNTSAYALDSGWGGNMVRQPTEDKEDYGQIDLVKSLDGPIETLRFGYKHRDHQTSQEQFLHAFSGVTDTVATIGGGLTPGDYLDGFSGVTQDSKSRVVVDKALLQAYIQRVAGAIADVRGDGSTYSVEEKIDAGYAQADFKTNGLRGNFGVRYVHTNQDSFGYVNSVPTSQGKTYNKWLPSVNVAYDASDSVVLRGSIAKVIARANYADLTPYVSLSDTVHTGNGGNPNLNPYASTNFDASAEWYFAENAYVSVNAFYKDISNYILNTTASEQQANVSNHNVIETYQVSRPRNAGGAETKGLSVSYQQNYAYGLGLQANYTYSDASADGGGDLPYNSKNQVNISPFIETGPFTARVTYAWRSKYFTGVDRGDQMYARAYTQVDASAAWAFNDRLQLTVDASNLLDEKYYAYANTEQQVRAIYRSGRRYSAGLHFKF